MALTIELLSPDLSTPLPLPFAESGIQAGFPSPAEDCITENLDLNQLLVRHPAATRHHCDRPLVGACQWRPRFVLCRWGVYLETGPF